VNGRKRIYEKHIEFKNKKVELEKFFKESNKRAFCSVSDKKIITPGPVSQKKDNKKSEEINNWSAVQLCKRYDF